MDKHASAERNEVLFNSSKKRDEIMKEKRRLTLLMIPSVFSFSVFVLMREKVSFGLQVRLFSFMIFSLDCLTVTEASLHPLT